jgi:collagen type III alpha
MKARFFRWPALCASLALAPVAWAQDAPPAKPNPAELFQKLDANQDGQLARDEVPEAQRSLYDRLLANDKNADGTLSADEFAAGLKAEPPAPPPGGGRPGGPGGPGGPPPGGPDGIFRFLDKNNDGKVTADEVPEERRERFTAEMLPRADKDKDGALTLDEFRAAMPAAPPGTPGTPGQPGQPPRPGSPPPFGPPPGGDPLFRALDKDGDGSLSKDEVYGAAEALKTLDKNGDGTLSREEVFPPRPEFARGPGGPGGPGGMNPEDIMRRLREADRDGDGKLSKDEAPERMRENFDRVDTNSDGFVDQQELRQMFAAMGGRPGGPGGPGGFDPQRMVDGLFANADRDGDGKLSKEETPERMREGFDRIDADKDGSLSKDEVREAMARFARERGPGGPPGAPGEGPRRRPEGGGDRPEGGERPEGGRRRPAADGDQPAAPAEQPKSE